MLLKRLMVFTDFTEASSLAARHCFQVASRCKAEVLALHAITDHEDQEWAEKKTTLQIEQLDNYDKSIAFTPIVSKQNLFQGMNKWLEEREVDMTFMATHGKKDIQFLTGSHALKLIFNAEIPTMVVQHKTPLRPYRHILLPVFSHQVDMQFPAAALQAIARIFNSTLTMLTPVPKDREEKEEIQKTVDWLKGVFENDFSAIHVKQGNEPEKKFNNAVIAAIAEENIDLIAVVIGAKHHRSKSDKNKNFIQAVITNKEYVPVLCL